MTYTCKSHGAGDLCNFIANPDNQASFVSNWATQSFKWTLQSNDPTKFVPGDYNVEIKATLDASTPAARYVVYNTPQSWSDASATC